MTNDQEAKLIRAHKHGLYHARANVERNAMLESCGCFDTGEERQAFLAGYYQERKRISGAKSREA